MKGYAEEDVALQDGFEPNLAGSRYVPNVETCSPRRTRFFSFAETQKDFVSAEQEYALSRLIRENDPVVKQQMIVQHLRMVVGIVRRYTDRGVEFVDLVREGNQGLIHALEEFEPDGGLCFSTFVEDCICQSIERAIMDQYTLNGSLDDREMVFI